jgi:hypothetical protein
MTNSDKFLIGIVAGIILLVVAAFVIILTRPEPVYQAEDEPKNVAHNYLLALQKEDYERAYAYLSPTLEGYPTSVQNFSRDVLAFSWYFRLDTETTLTIKSARVAGQQAVVTVSEAHFGGGLFDRYQYDSTFKVKLQIESGQWKIVDADEYFLWCWKQSQGCQ